MQAQDQKERQNHGKPRRRSLPTCRASRKRETLPNGFRRSAIVAWAKFAARSIKVLGGM
jgi:hypothetical protein